MASLNKLLWFQQRAIRIRIAFYNRFWGMHIHPTAKLSMSVRLDKTYPAGIYIGERSYVAFEVAILTHDLTRKKKARTIIGRHCFIGARSTILPGVTVGDGAIVGAGSMVTADVPPHTIVAGNPARVLRRDIEVREYGVFKSAPAKAQLPQD
jgi:acetyltransferase-like isoleucine patch superfamily enzyme